ncbi:SUN domain-containing ossification factor-like isoform X2 [Portunus trituberculatus]|uniref:SUN domain-containing ossification factor-like isoform X2 n=1 Tax=Portunus trituberculatus TaxID=210409 RepID=UPI001E1D1CF5|nr:SUN domain-containing ossification factor-like isoform X2 [Portunus trituberculatus]XP_045130578.1 SUN domain-containing ossification factor-like isoform X2 [Portunus trituberculatus]
MARVEAAAAALFGPSTCFLWGDGGLPIFSLLGITFLLHLLQLCPAIGLHHDNNSVPPMGSGIEVMTKALGVVDVEMDVAPGNTSINPVSAVNGRRSIFSRKSEVTLSHIFGAKEFLKHFPAENFTHLRTHRPGYSKSSQKDTAASEETQPQHKSESASKEESRKPVKGETVIDSEAIIVPDGTKEVSSSSIPTESKEIEDRREAQEKSENESVPPAAETAGDSITTVADGKGKKNSKLDKEAQQHEAQGQVESRQEVATPLQPSLTDMEAKEEIPHPIEVADSVKVEAETVAETHQTPSDVGKSLEEPTQETQTTEPLPPLTESKNVSEPAIKAEEDQKAVVKEESKAEDLPEKTVKEQLNVTEKKEGVVSTEAEEKKKSAVVDIDAGDEGTKKKKKPSESEKPKKKEAVDKKADAKQGEEKEKSADTLETYSQFTQRVNAEKKNDIMTNGHGTNGHGKGSKVKSKNYASPDCGSKLLTANPEATHASKVIHSNKDEYLLNKCRDKTWFIIELCESIRPQKFDIANFELFSNLPKDIHVLGSHRYPSRDWTSLASAQGQEGNRGVQSFPVETEDFFKYIKVEVHSHYGHEYFCPISLFRIYGLSEFEVIDTVEDSEEPEEAEIFSEAQLDDKKVKDEGKPSVIPAVIKNMFSGVLDVIKRGYRPHTSTSESGDNCYTLQPTHTVDKRSCQLADSLNYILSCYHAEYQMLMQTSFVSNTVKNSGFCRLLASTMCLTPEVSDSVVYDTVCNSSYLCIMLSPKHLLAMCFMHDGRIVNSQVECESAGTLLPENFSTTTPPILPTENRMPSYVKNAKINTSTITRTDATVPCINGAVAQAEEGWSDQGSGAKNIPVESVAVGQEEPVASPASDSVIAEPSVPKKAKSPGSSQDQVVKEEEQPDNTTELEERVTVEGGSIVGVEITEEESVKEEEEKHEEEHPHPVTPLPVETKLSSTSPTNKESVVVRLSNKIKALEYNMSISSQYLEELSRRYKSQMEEMQRQFNLTIAALNATSRQAFERDQHHQRDIEMLEEQLASVTAILRKLVEERESLAHTVVEQHLLLMVVEVVVLCVVFVLCYKRTTRHRLLELEGQERRAQTPSEDPSDRQGLGGSNSLSGWTRGRVRRRSVDSITRERSSNQRRCRRPSEEALRISGTYEDLLIIEPAIPIMVDSVSDRKKKRKSSNGVLKRSKSNASIVEKSCNSSKRSQRLENLDVSSAGVLFCGDQVETKGASNNLQVDPASLQFSGDTVDSPVSADMNSPRSYVEEVMSAPHPHNDINAVTLKKHSTSCSQISENLNRNWGKLTKSHSLNYSSEKLRNGAEKKKKKLKKRNTIQESPQPYSHEAELYPETNRTSYNGLSEHNPEYYYNGRSSVHFSETSDALGNHMFSSDVTNGSSYINGDSSQDLGYVGSEYMHSSSYVTNFSEKRRTSPAAKVKLRSDNWEWYSLHHFGSSSETVSTCSDSSGKTRKGRHDEVPHTQDQSDDKKVKKKKKGKSRAPVLLEEETNGGT